MHYSEQLKAVMERIVSGRTYRHVAEQAKCDHTLIYDMTRAGRVPRRETLGRIADNLGLAGEQRTELFTAAGYIEHLAGVEVAA